MYLEEDRQRDAALKSPAPAQPAAGGFQSQASRAAAPPPYTPSTEPANATSNKVAVTRQPNGAASFSGMGVGAGPVQYEGSAKGFRPGGGTVNTMSAANFAQANPSTAGTLGDARRTAMQAGNLDAVAASMGAPVSRQGAVASGAERVDGRLGFNQDEARTLLRDAMTKRPGESRADFATRSGAAQRALGLETDERGNIRGNQTQQRGQNLGFATSEAERQSRELLEARRQKLDDQRLGLDAGRLQLDAFKATQPEAQKAPAGYRWSEQGNLQAIPGGPADLKRDGKLTEDQGKSAGYAARMANAMNLIDSIGKNNPDATRPGAGTALLNMLPEGVANLIRPDDRQRVEAAQLDALDAALTLNTGAAYTREQLQGMTRSYFAQPGDSDQTAAEKQQRLSSLIETARLRAGPQGSEMADAVVQRNQQQPATTPARQAGPPAVPQAGQVVRGYRFLGGDPADRNNWEAGQ